MPSKTSWFNRELLILDFRSVGWISLLYTIALFFIMPVKIMFVLSNDHRYTKADLAASFTDPFQINWFFQVLIYFIVPILLAIFLFRFIHVKEQAELIHAFPIKREKIFVQKAFSGVIFLTVPLLVNAVILVVLTQVFDISSFLSFGEIAEWFGTIWLFLMVLFFASVFISMLTGISAVQGILTYIFLFFPVGFSILLFLNLQNWFYGFPANYFIFEEIERYSPLSRLAMLFNSPLKTSEVAIGFILLVLFIGLSIILYRKRKLESASHAIAFHQLKPVFKYGVTFCFMLLGGMYFLEVERSSDSLWVYFGYFWFSIIGYFIAEMILQKSWRVFGAIKGYLVYAFVMSIVFIGLHFDFTGYEKKVPALEEIDHVYFGPYLYETEENLKRHYEYDSEEAIEAIYNLHSEIVKTPTQQGSSYEEVNIHYKLKNGETMIRNYTLSNSHMFKEELNAIYATEEYKEKQFKIYKVDPKAVDRITIEEHDITYEKHVITDPDMIEEAVTMLQKDIQEVDYDVIHMDAYKNYTTFTLNNGDVFNVYGTERFKQFTKWLESNGFKGTALEKAEKVSHLFVAKESDLQTIEDERFYMENVFFNGEEYDFFVKVTDKQLIAHAMEHTTDPYEIGISGELYYVGFYPYSDTQYPVMVRAYDETTIPEDLKEMLQ